ncbi:MAG: ROK family protein [Proteobacteria bacterium]|nr:ROK family protein [Burkholderiales bacterium]
MRIGVDLGGTKIEAIALDADGAECARVRRATPQGDYEATLDAIQALVVDLETRAGGRRAHIGVATPGALSTATGRLKNSNSVCLNGRPLATDLEARLERPLRFANDANCFALSEATDGSAAGRRVVFGVILGTGVGGGIVIDGRVVDGRNAIAGEWGHNPLQPIRDDECPSRCYCGRLGCIETWLSGPALAQDHQRHTGQTMDAEDISAGAAHGDLACRATLERYCERAGRALAGVINLLDPDVIVLGGGVSNIDTLYERIPLYWREHVFSDSIDTELVRNRHGDSSGVRGAAWLWPA